MISVYTLCTFFLHIIEKPKPFPLPPRFMLRDPANLVSDATSHRLCCDSHPGHRPRCLRCEWLVFP